MSKPCVLITRPAEDAGRFSRMLEQRGYETYCEPMLFLQNAPGASVLLDALDARKTQALIITSRHSLQALQRFTYLHDVPLYAIGDADTYDVMVRSFSQITIVRDLQALYRTIMTECVLENGPLIYVRGKFVTHDLSKMFKRQGFEIQEIVAYDMRALEKLSPRLTEKLRKGEIHTATFLSGRTAQIFMEITEAAGLTDVLKSMRAAVFSENIATALQPEKWGRVGVCENPTLPCLLTEVDKLASTD